MLFFIFNSFTHPLTHTCTYILFNSFHDDQHGLRFLRELPVLGISRVLEQEGGSVTFVEEDHEWDFDERMHLDTLLDVANATLVVKSLATAVSSASSGSTSGKGLAVALAQHVSRACIFMHGKVSCVLCFDLSIARTTVISNRAQLH
jgi:hypothetical protein